MRRNWQNMALDFSSIRLPERAVDRRILPNGTVFLYTPNPYNQIVAVRILSRLASRHECAEKAGMANLCLRMLSAGTERHSEEEIADNLERNGAHFKAEAGKDWSAIDLLTTTHFLREDLETVLELIDCPTFLEEKLVRERETTRMNILEQEDSRLSYTMRIFRQKFFGSHPYAWPNIGLVETLDRIQRDDLVPFAHAAFDPSRLTAVAVGGPENGSVQTIIEECLASRDRRNSEAIPDPPPASPAISSDTEVTDHRQSEAEYVVLGYPGAGIAEPAAVPLCLIGALLGGSMDSRLFREIREKRGLCYQVGSHYHPHCDLSPLMIYLVTSPANREEAVACAEAEIRRVKEEPVTEEELERIKTYVCGTYIMSMETNMGQASRYAIYEIAGLGWGYVNRFPDEVSRVTDSQISDTARRYFTHRLLAITSPKESEPD